MFWKGHKVVLNIISFLDQNLVGRRLCGVKRRGVFFCSNRTRHILILCRKLTLLVSKRNQCQNRVMIVGQSIDKWGVSQKVSRWSGRSDQISSLLSPALPRNHMIFLHRRRVRLDVVGELGLRFGTTLSLLLILLRGSSRSSSSGTSIASAWLRDLFGLLELVIWLGIDWGLRGARDGSSSFANDGIVAVDGSAAELNGGGRRWRWWSFIHAQTYSSWSLGYTQHVNAFHLCLI